MIDSLMSIIKKEGIILDNENSVKMSLQKAINADKFKFIYSDDRIIGFFSFENKDNYRVFINNLVIFNNYKGSYRLRDIGVYLKKEYGFEKFVWRNRKLKKQSEFIRSDYAMAK